MNEKRPHFMGDHRLLYHRQSADDLIAPLLASRSHSRRAGYSLRLSRPQSFGLKFLPSIHIMMLSSAVIGR